MTDHQLDEAHVLQERDFASRSPHGKFLVAEKSGHFIHRDQPDLVIQAIRHVVEAARDRTTPPSKQTMHLDEVPTDKTRALLGSIDITTVVGLHDRAMLAILVYTASRAGAVASLKSGNFYRAGEQSMLHF